MAEVMKENSRKIRGMGRGDIIGMEEPMMENGIRDNSMESGLISKKTEPTEWESGNMAYE